MRTPRMLLRGGVLAAALLVAFSGLSQAQSTSAAQRGYLRYPDLNGDKVVFTSSDDLWLADVSGGRAARLTAHEGREFFAKFSPDGMMIAFTGNYYGNQDVYVMPVDGGMPTQLTFHGAKDQVVGWDESGRVIFRSDRQPPFWPQELYAVDPDGGFPEKLPYESGSRFSEEPNGDRVAFVPINNDFQNWNHYRGGRAEKIWVGDPTIPEFKKLSIYNGDERFPMWHTNGRIYFVMDKTGRENLWSVQPDGSDLRREFVSDDDDVRFPSMDGDNIIFQKGMDLAVFNVTTKQVCDLVIDVPTDLYVGRTKWVDGEDYLRDWSINEDGTRIVVESRGELFTFPVKAEGLTRQWTFSSKSREKSPRFLPESDGLLAITDVTGEERLVSIDVPNGEMVELERTPLNDWKYHIEVSPDGRYVALANGRMNLFVYDLEKKNRRLVSTGGWEFNTFVWSPDSRYLAYVQEEGEGDLTHLYVHDTRNGKNYLVADDYYNTGSPAWDPEGRYLYCVTNRNFSPYQDYNRGILFYSNEGVLAAIRLREEVPSPFLAKGDAAEEGVEVPEWWTLKEDDEEKEESDDSEGVAPIEIEFKGIQERMVPMKTGNLHSLAAVGNSVYVMKADLNWSSDLYLYNMDDRSFEQVAANVSGYQLSNDGSTLVLRSGGSFYYGAAGSASFAMDGDHCVNTSDWEIEVNPNEEWAQILREAWRQYREFFYDSDLHAVDWDEVYERFAPNIERMTTREDVQDLIREVEAEINSGHAFIGLGDAPRPESTPVGFLGADLTPNKKSGFYKIAKVYAPEPGTPGNNSPLHDADPTIREGKTYLLAIDGRRVEASKNIYRLLQNKAGKNVALTLNEKPSFDGAREIIVTTLHRENALRYREWVKDMQRYVAEKSKGKLGYMYLPDMSGAGMEEFGRHYYTQRNLPGMVIDDRWNSGGNISEVILKEMFAPIHTVQSGRFGGEQHKPHGAYFGHAAVMINEITWSDGEMFAHSLNATGVAPTIGMRTGGGGIWLWARRPLMDGAFISVPEFGSYNMDGEWVIEGSGVSPKIEVENDPASLIKGVDKQLDYTIDYLLKKLESDPPKYPKQPKHGPFGPRK